MIVSSVVVVVVVMVVVPMMVVVVVVVLVVVVVVVVLVVVVVVMVAVPSYESDGERDDEAAHSVAKLRNLRLPGSALLRTTFLDTVLGNWNAVSSSQIFAPARQPRNAKRTGRFIVRVPVLG